MSQALRPGCCAALPAAHWVDIASVGELKAYALTSFTRLSPRGHSAFLGNVQRRAAA